MSAQERRVYLALALGFCALLVASAAGFFAVRTLRNESALVDQTHQVRRQLALLLATHRDIQTGGRGFVLTGNPDYLQPYEQAKTRSEAIYRELAALVQDNPAQNVRLEPIDMLHKQQIAHAEQIIQTRQDAGIEAARQIIESGEDKRLADALLAAIREMDTEEALLLEVRYAEELRAANRLNWTLLASTVFAFLVVGLGGAIIHRDFRLRHRSEQTILEQNAWLESRVQERTAELRKSETRFRLLIEGVRDYAIIMLDPQGRVLTWNSGAQDIKGYSQSEILGQPMSCFYTPEDQAANKPERLLAAAAAAGRCEDEGWLLRKGGSRFQAFVVITAVHDEAGNLIGFAKITQDITERKRAEERTLRHAQEQEATNTELTRFNRSMVDRELRMIELKEEINALCRQLGQPKRYDIPTTQGEA